MLRARSGRLQRAHGFLRGDATAQARPTIGARAEEAGAVVVVAVAAEGTASGATTTGVTSATAAASSAYNCPSSGSRATIAPTPRATPSSRRSPSGCHPTATCRPRASRPPSTSRGGAPSRTRSRLALAGASPPPRRAAVSGCAPRAWISATPRGFRPISASTLRCRMCGWATVGSRCCRARARRRPCVAVAGRQARRGHVARCEAPPARTGGVT